MSADDPDPISWTLAPSRSGHSYNLAFLRGRGSGIQSQASLSY